MADFPHSSRSYVKAYRSRSGAPPIKSYQESTAASTALIAFGNVVTFDASSAAHRIVRASTMSGQAPFLGSNVVGVAAEGSTSDGSTAGLADYRNRQISVWEAAPSVEFLFPTKLVIASTLVNTGLELSWDSTLNIHHVSANSTAGDLTVRITDVIPGTVGDTGGYLVGRFFSSVVAPSISGL